MGAADDPYKRYWWAILAGFAAVGVWLCVPLMEAPIGSVRVDAAKPAMDVADIERSLDSAENPSGAPGGALGLSKAGAREIKDADDAVSRLYQPPAETGAAAAGKPLVGAPAPAASLARQLKDAGKKDDSSGWTEKAQRGFSAPRLSGGGLSGSGSVGGGFSASAGGSVGVFGSRNAEVGFSETRGLRGDGSAGSAAPAGVKAPKASDAASAPPSLKGSAESMSAAMGRSFDGTGARAAAPIGAGALAQANAALDAAPANLKANDPKLDVRKMTPPDPPAAAPADAGPDMVQQLLMMGATTLIGGMIGGAGGQMVMMMATQMFQQQQAAAASARQQAAVKKYGST